MTPGHRILGIIEGDSDPQSFIPELIVHHAAGLFPVERLIQTFPLDQINEAVAAQARGDCIKVVLIPWNTDKRRVTMEFGCDYAMLIGGRLDGGSARFDVLNPATEQVIGSAPDASKDYLDRAIAAARAAFPGWAATPIAERKAALIAMGQAVKIGRAHV